MIEAIVEVIDNEITRHKDVSKKYLSCIEKCYDREHSPVKWLFSLIKPDKADKKDFAKSYLKDYRYHKFAASEFEMLKTLVRHEIQRLTKLKKNKRTIKVKVLKIIDEQMNFINRHIQYASSQTDSIDYECYSQLFNDYNQIKLQIEKL